MTSPAKSRSTAVAFITAAVLLVLSGIVQLGWGHPTGEEVEGFGGYAVLVLLVALLWSFATGFLNIARTTDRTGARIGAYAVAIGQIVLGAVAVTSIVNGKDLSIFVVFAPLTNAAWLFGQIAIAVSLRRARRIPLWVAIGMPFTQVFALGLSAVGGGIVAGVFWLVLGTKLANGTLNSASEATAGAVVAAA
jgi:hypothetical protein